MIVNYSSAALIYLRKYEWMVFRAGILLSLYFHKNNKIGFFRILFLEYKINMNAMLNFSMFILN
jgi:hypothetical protein